MLIILKKSDQCQYHSDRTETSIQHTVIRLKSGQGAALKKKIFISNSKQTNCYEGRKEKTK
jgi:hypothetical protein